MIDMIKLAKYSQGERLYPIGFKFEHKRGKQDTKVKEVIDYRLTFNVQGAVVKFEYVLQYPMLGQQLTELVVQTTIDIATNNGWKNLL